MYIDLDREAVLRVSFLRGLRGLRVKSRRSDLSVQIPRLRSG